MDNEDLEFAGVIVDKKLSPGTNSAGQPYKRATFNIMDVNGTVLILSTFNEETINNFNVGANVTAHYHKNGKYNNLDGFEQKEGTTIPTAQESNQAIKQVATPQIENGESYEEKEDRKQKAIVRQNVLHRAVDMFLAGKADDIFKEAQKFEDWVLRK